MRKIVYLSVFLVTIFLGFFLSTSKALAVFECTEWGVPVCSQIDQITGVCIGKYSTPCIGGKDTGLTSICPPGTYSCNTGCCPVGTDSGGGLIIPCSHAYPTYHKNKLTPFVTPDGLIGAVATWRCEGASGRRISCWSKYGHVHFAISRSPDAGGCTKVTGPTEWCPIGRTIYINGSATSYRVDPLAGAYPLTPGVKYYFKVWRDADDCHNSGSASALTSCKISDASRNITAVLGKGNPYLSSGVLSKGVNRVRFYTSDAGTVSVLPVPTATPRPGRTPTPMRNYIDDTTFPYGVTLYPIKTTGTTPVTITQNVLDGTTTSNINNPACSDTALVTVTDSVSYEPWWQVKNSDVMSGYDLI